MTCGFEALVLVDGAWESPQLKRVRRFLEHGWLACRNPLTCSGLVMKRCRLIPKVYGNSLRRKRGQMVSRGRIPDVGNVSRLVQI